MFRFGSTEKPGRMISYAYEDICKIDIRRLLSYSGLEWSDCLSHSSAYALLPVNKDLVSCFHPDSGDTLAYPVVVGQGVGRAHNIHGDTHRLSIHVCTQFGPCRTLRCICANEKQRAGCKQQADKKFHRGELSFQEKWSMPFPST